MMCVRFLQYSVLPFFISEWVACVIDDSMKYFFKLIEKVLP
jgi:hypothetical protein